MTMEPGVIFSGVIPTSTTVYVPIAIRNGTVGAFIEWPDAVSAAAITLELTSSNANTWKDSGVTITGPAAAVGSSLVNVENVRQKKARLKIVTTAVTNIDIWDGTGS